MRAGFITRTGFTPGKWNNSRVSLNKLDFLSIMFYLIQKTDVSIVQ